MRIRGVLSTSVIVSPLLLSPLSSRCHLSLLISQLLRSKSSCSLPSNEEVPPLPFLTHIPVMATVAANRSYHEALSRFAVVMSTVATSFDLRTRFTVTVISSSLQTQTTEHIPELNVSGSSTRTPGTPRRPNTVRVDTAGIFRRISSLKTDCPSIMEPWQITLGL